MPLLPYANRLEPVEDAAIWRYLDLRKFRDLIASEELYFRRADLFTDKSEGLPPEQYAMRVLGLDPYDIHVMTSISVWSGVVTRTPSIVWTSRALSRRIHPRARLHCPKSFRNCR